MVCHVGEIILTHVFDDLKVEASKSPEIAVFARLRKNWDYIPHQLHQLNHIDVGQLNEETQNLVTKWKSEVLEIAHSQLQYRRDDYREFLSLCVAYLTPEQNRIKFIRPGAIHKARWMAKLISALKMTLLENQLSGLPKGSVATPAQITKIIEFVNFVSLVYIASFGYNISM